MLDSADVQDLLGVSRQRVHVLAQERQHVVLPKGRGYQFPAWQFAGTDGTQRAGLGRAQQTLVDAGGISPWSAASTQPDLGDQDAVTFLTHGGDPELLVQVAARDADRAAQ